MSVGVGRLRAPRSPTRPATKPTSDDRAEPAAAPCAAGRRRRAARRRRRSPRAGSRGTPRRPARTDTVPPPSSVSPMAIDSGMPSSTMPTVRLRAAVASAPAGTARRRPTSSASSTGSSGSSRSARRLSQRGERVVARPRRRAGRCPAGARPASRVRLGHEVGGDRADQRAGAERHHQTEPARLGELREARDEQRADDQRRLAERRPQPRFEHETGVSRAT